MVNARPTVADYMATDLLTLSPGMEINHAVAVLLERRFSGAPVVDDAGNLVGVLSKKDCLRAALNATYYQEWGGVVQDYMSKPAAIVEPDLDLVQAAQLFLDSAYRRFPVTREGKLVGQISRADLLRAMAEQWNAN